jgi:hypothetical protein
VQRLSGRAAQFLGGDKAGGYAHAANSASAQLVRGMLFILVVDMDAADVVPVLTL